MPVWAQINRNFLPRVGVCAINRSMAASSTCASTTSCFSSASELHQLFARDRPIRVGAVVQVELADAAGTDRPHVPRASSACTIA
jgi:hypothetical protein